MAVSEIKPIMQITEVEKISSSGFNSGGHVISQSNKSEDSLKSKVPDYGPAVNVDPSFVMTPDGVLHSKAIMDEYNPVISMSSYSTPKINIIE